MSLAILSWLRRYWPVLAVLAACLALCALLGNLLAELLGLALGASALAFLLFPVARWFEGGLPRSAAAVAALLSGVMAVAAALWLLLPALLRQARQLSQSLPDALSALSGWIAILSERLKTRFPGFELPNVTEGIPMHGFSALASGTVSLASGVAQFIGRFSLMAVLSAFLMADRASLLLRLELLIPQRLRGAAVCIGKAVCRELRLYLRAQATIALTISALACTGLLLLRVRGALVLGPMVGILNMIPYIGPLIGGVPAVLSALGDGYRKALLTGVLLVVIQQLDGSVISPRIMGSVTGLPAAWVLIAIFAGAKLAGIVGMLLALPVLMVIRTVFRVFVQRYENI